MNKSKPINWLHISDIHFHQKSDWRDSAIHDAFLKYLKGLFDAGAPKPDLIFCTGDIAFGETKAAPMAQQYESAARFFGSLRDACGSNGAPLPRDRVYIVPGNHDVNRSSINSDAQSLLTGWAENARNHIDKINQRFNDRPREFVDTVLRLSEYGNFIAEHFSHQVDPDGRIVYAREIELNGLKIGICGFNSAWTCAGPEDDRNIWLAADWQFNAAAKGLRTANLRIALMHHPIDWLNIADREVAKRRLAGEFDFFLHGHTHDSWVDPNQSCVTVSAGAVAADQPEEFGFNLVSLDLSRAVGTVCLHTKASKTNDWVIQPIPQHAPDGKWRLDLSAKLRDCASSAGSVHKTTDVAAKVASESGGTANVLVGRYLRKRLDDALLSFGSHRSDWISPVLCSADELEQNSEAAEKFNVNDLVASPMDTVISAPPQYGLTCLAHYMVHEAWDKHSTFWLYLDARTVKPNNASLGKAIDDELQVVGVSRESVGCVVVDSWTGREKDDVKLFKLVCEIFKGVPVLCMRQADAATFAFNPDTALRSFRELHLWALSREQIRIIVSCYNSKRQVGEEDVVTARLIADLEMLNLHRTPLNCLTLLKVSEVDFDESPVNRSEMIKRVLFLIFNTDDVPTYKSRPDVKDCEYVLGYFCEHLIRSGQYTFARDGFLLKIQECARDRLIDMETHLVFDVLFENNIIVKRGLFFEFRFAYWIFYFAAQRMHHDAAFATYILSEMRYAQHPELIEFYTGIDRHRTDAIEVLIEDLSALYNGVEKNVGFPKGFNPYRLAKWEATSEGQASMENEIQNGVRNSNLPSEVKDQYADKYYDRTRPYNQTVPSVLSGHSFTQMMHGVKAGARALRNSDYVAPELKRTLLQEILQCWELITMVLFVLLPTLAKDETAVYEGTLFVLGHDFGDTAKKRALRILEAIPFSIARLYEDDLFSMKMGPLLIDQLKKGSGRSELSTHELMLVLLRKRPRNWSQEVERYISSLPRNSFFLHDVYRTLQGQYRYAFASNQTLGEIEKLIKMAAVKHVTKLKSPGAKAIEKTKINQNVIPPREASDTAI
ncbi:metallophosphoesterase [Paraburkholderia azotifigens]|uniref:metallophosphoesterase n=1 Tax=Paraburkholderia azotifigens TaxID=2057004 RepID=UPI003171D613